MSGRPRIEALLMVVELNGPTMMARIGVMRGLNCHVERMFKTDRKDKDWSRSSGTNEPSPPIVGSAHPASFLRVTQLARCGIPRCS
jgi:hypothetical protein